MTETVDYRSLWNAFAALLYVNDFEPFGEEASTGIKQQEELFLSLGAVAGIQIVLQRDRPLNCADHIDVPLLNTTGKRENKDVKRKKKRRWTKQ